ncbi:hypothetical protein K7X08_011587 [Anisodus acutangulus]|uniref:Uncharacterized protein n=1 Tax=Anisodus acutangulus TaxID=402998 RepID=A0A9Q1RM12_9SOLA|nr:hypothetical protein K7X08_011587 [Anisodus acutangulus]
MNHDPNTKEQIPSFSETSNEQIPAKQIIAASNTSTNTNQGDANNVPLNNVFPQKMNKEKARNKDINKQHNGQHHNSEEQLTNGEDSDSEEEEDDDASESEDEYESLEKDSSSSEVSDEIAENLISTFAPSMEIEVQQAFGGNN